jgi:NitT/TauT family transport system substrate-binding protein
VTIKLAAKTVLIRISALMGLIGVLAGGSVEASAESAPVKLTIAIGRSGPQAVVWLAEIYGLYKQQGLDVEITDFRNASDTVAAGASGAVNVIASGIETPAILTQRGLAPWRNIVAIYGTSAFSIVAQPDLKIVPGDLKALKGLRIGVSGLGRPSYAVGVFFLRQAGLDPDNDVTFVEQPPGPEGVVAWDRRIADVAVVNEPVTSALLLRKSAKMFLDLRQGKNGPISQAPQAAVQVPLSLIRNNRAELERFVTAVCLATKRAVQNPKEAAQLLAQRWGSDAGGDADVVKAGIIASAVGWKNEIPREPTMAWFDLLTNMKILNKLPAFDDVVDVSFSKGWHC